MTSKHKPNILYIGASDGFFTRETLRGILSMRSEGCNWNFCNLPLDCSINDLQDCIETNKVEGIITRGLPEDTAMFIYENKLPCVFIRSGEDDSAVYINGPHPDDEMIGQLAGQAFDLLNLTQWGFVHWEEVMWSEARRQSFQNHAEACGVNSSLISIKKSDQQSWKATKLISEWLKTIPKPCGILACNDKAGLEVIQAAQILKLRVPDDVAVIGVDNDHLICESSAVSLSSIDLKAANTGRAAAVQLGIMLGNLDKNTLPPVNQASYVVRQSSQNTDHSQLIFQKALDRIKSQPLTKLSVSALAKACGVSRRSLERAFVKCNAESPASLIRQSRSKAIIALIQEQSSSLESIAEQAGFSDAAGLSNFVKRLTGKNPGAFRKPS